MIKEVLTYPTVGEVVAFDENGDEIPELRGKYWDVQVKILAQVPKGAKFFHSHWGLRGLVKEEVSRKEW